MLTVPMELYFGWILCFFEVYLNLTFLTAIEVLGYLMVLIVVMLASIEGSMLKMLTIAMEH